MGSSVPPTSNRFYWFDWGSAPSLSSELFRQYNSPDVVTYQRSPSSPISQEEYHTIDETTLS